MLQLCHEHGDFFFFFCTLRLNSYHYHRHYRYHTIVSIFIIVKIIIAVVNVIIVISIIIKKTIVHITKLCGSSVLMRTQYTLRVSANVKDRRLMALDREGRQQQRPELPTVSLTWHASKYTVPKFHHSFNE